MKRNEAECMDTEAAARSDKDVDLTVPDCAEKEHDDTDPQPDNVNHPSHYKIGEYECFTEMRALFGIDALISYCKLAVYKYRYRFTKKNGDEDLKKAGWYMRELMKLEEEKAAAE